MRQFLYDMIHMSEGEKLLNYWWLWLIGLLTIFSYLSFKFKDK